MILIYESCMIWILLLERNTRRLMKVGKGWNIFCVCVCLYWDTIPVVIFISEKFPSPSTHTAPVVLVFHLNFILNRMNWGWRMAGYDNRIYA